MNWTGTYETDLQFLLAWIHMGEKSGQGFIQISFPVIGHMNDEVKQIHITEQEADFVFDINDMPCTFHLTKNSDGVKGTMDMPSMSMHLEFEPVKISEESGFADFHCIVPPDNAAQLKEHGQFECQAVDAPFTYELNDPEVLAFVRERGIDVENHHDFDTMQQLMCKTTRLIHHDGANYIHDRENLGTIAQILHAEKQGNFTNCRGMSLIFAGVLRAYGFMANHVECRPLNVDDSELHVVCEAFVPDLDKTVLFDVSSNLIYFYNGIPLSLFELRNIIADREEEKLTINEDAVHGTEKVDVIKSVAYMSKNSFFFCKAIHSGENTEIEEKNAICLTSKDLLDRASDMAAHVTCNPEEFYVSQK